MGSLRGQAVTFILVYVSWGEFMWDIQFFNNSPDKLAKTQRVIKVLLPIDAQNNCFNLGIKIYIKTAPTCFDVITIIRERTV
jgi:hypothetical protein